MVKKSLFIGICISLVLLLILFKNRSAANSAKTKKVSINGHSLTVEVADNDSLRTQGLSGRASLSPDRGMLFIFPASTYYRFWMKDMKFALDFIWIDKNTIIDVSENVSTPSSLNEPLKTFTAKYTFDKVIEVNAGVVKSLNIQIGDTVR